MGAYLSPGRLIDNLWYAILRLMNVGSSIKDYMDETSDVAITLRMAPKSFDVKNTILITMKYTLSYILARITISFSSC